MPDILNNNNTVDLPDGGAIVNLGSNGPQLLPPNPSEVINLVPIIKSVELDKYPSYLNEDNKKSGSEIIKEIGDIVVSEYKIDDSSRSVWKENVSTDIKLFKIGRASCRERV